MLARLCHKPSVAVELIKAVVTKLLQTKLRAGKENLALERAQMGLIYVLSEI